MSIGARIGRLTLAGLQVMPTLALNAASQKLDTTRHYHIFVGDLAPEIESHQLKEAFSAFGIVTECKIIKDMHTQKPKGYGFVAFANKEEAEEAMQKMNGQLLGSRTIRTNWAVRKPPQTPGAEQKPLNYDEVAQAASTSNCTVYVGGITKGLCEDLVKDAFKEYGEILEVRVFKEKGYAFVRFDNHEAATKAIITMHGRDVGNQPCKCSWGKESNDKETAAEALLSTPLSYYSSALGYQQYANQLSYLQQQPFSYTNYATAAANYQAAAAAAAASTGLLNGSAAATYTGTPSAYTTAQLAAASHAFATPTSAAVSFQQAH